MRILQYKQSVIAYAPDELSNAINKYTKHNSSVMYNRYIGKAPDFTHVNADIIHFHNKAYPVNKKSVIQYHSEPYMVDLAFNGNKKLVISQYHATLPEFRDCQIVRNIIDIYDKAYNYVEVKNKIVIAFSPSRKERIHGSKWHDKGYAETINVLNKIKSTFGSSVEIDIITDVPLGHCLERKSRANIIIDECVTGSFHRSGLEGLALGKMTICGVSKEVEDVLLKSSGSDINPFYNVNINGLYIELARMIESGVTNINEMGYKNKIWMERYWNPKTIVGEFVKIYEDLV